MKEKWRFLDEPVDDAVAKHLFDKLHKETWHITQKPKAKFLSGTTLLNQSNYTRNNLSSTHLCLAATQGLPFPVLAPFLQKNCDGDQGVHRKVSLCRFGVMGRGKEGGLQFLSCQTCPELPCCRNSELSTSVSAFQGHSNQHRHRKGKKSSLASFWYNLENKQLGRVPFSSAVKIVVKHHLDSSQRDSFTKISIGEACLVSRDVSHPLTIHWDLCCISLYVYNYLLWYLSSYAIVLLQVIQTIPKAWHTQNGQGERGGGAADFPRLPLEIGILGPCSHFLASVRKLFCTFI